METNLHSPVVTEHDDVLINLYTLNKQWISEINFLGDEMKFMNDLLEKFFPNFINQEHINRIQLIKMQLDTLNIVRKNIKTDILRHQENIEDVINQSSAKSDAFLQLEDERMDEELRDFNKSFKQLKKEIFDITRVLLHSNKIIQN